LTSAFDLNYSLNAVKRRIMSFRRRVAGPFLFLLLIFHSPIQPSLSSKSVYASCVSASTVTNGEFFFPERLYEPESPRVFEMHGLLQSVWSPNFFPSCTSPLRLYSDTSSTASNDSLACYGIVDYPFILPYNTTAEALNKRAVNQLKDATYHILSASCQLSIKKAVCANVYRKCPAHYISSDTSTWNTAAIQSDFGSSVPLTVALPYLRPCKSVCDDVKAQCGALLKVFKDSNGWLNCSSARISDSDPYFTGLGYTGIIPSYGPFVYERSNNATVCNAMSSPSNSKYGGQVASSVEAYG
jgi:hypothetical protein